MSVSDWFLVETAPKDGRDVLLRGPGFEQRAFWCAAPYYGSQMGWVGEASSCKGATHWKPIDDGARQ
jgi:hypothetical protein